MPYFFLRCFREKNKREKIAIKIYKHNLKNVSVKALVKLHKRYRAKGLKHIVQNESLQRLITALIQSRTECPMTKSNVMPVEIFVADFYNMTGKRDASVKDLRLIDITRLALTLMSGRLDILRKQYTLRRYIWLYPKTRL